MTFLSPTRFTTTTMSDMLVILISEALSSYDTAYYYTKAWKPHTHTHTHTHRLYTMN